MHNFVYLTENLVNKKKYIGSHSSQNINDRYFGSGRIFLKAIKKYGKKNFRRTILKECSTIEEARELEGIFIKEYNTLIPFGYNSHPQGGPTNKGGLHSEETKEKMRQAAISRWKNGDERIKQGIRFKGREVSEETRDKLRKSLSGMPSPMKGRSHSEEAKEKIRGKITGTKLSEETKLKISKNNSKTKYWEGKKLSNEHKQRIANSLDGKKRGKYKIKIY